MCRSEGFSALYTVVSYLEQTLPRFEGTHSGIKSCIEDKELSINLKLAVLPS